MATVVWIARAEGRVWRRNLTFVTWGDFGNAVEERAVMGLSGAVEDLPGWLASRMRDGDVSLPDRDRHCRVVLEGIARLTPRGVQVHQGPMTDWDDEGRLLLQMYLTPMDACKIKVLDAMRLKDPIAITHREELDKKKLRNTLKIRKVSGTTKSSGDIWVPVLPSNADFTLENNRSVQDQIASWRAQGDQT